MEVKESISKRLQYALSVCGMKQVDLVEKTQIPKGSISQYVSGFVEPKSDRIYLMAKALGVDPAWLMGLDVPMRKDLSAKYSTEVAETLIDIKNVSVLYDFITDYKKLTGQQQEIVRNLVKSMLP